MDKPRMVRVTDQHERDDLIEHWGDLDTPRIVRSSEGIFVDADELRAWRAARTQPQSDPEAI